MRWTLGLASCGLLGSLLVASCASDEDAACSDYGDQCGKPCTADTDCAAGLNCGSNKTCTAACSSKHACADGATCTFNGRCVGGTMGTGGNLSSTAASFSNGSGSGNGSGNGSTGSSCGDIVISFTPQTPTVMLLIDQSGSMNANFGGKTRWDALRDSLMDPATGVVKALESKVRFALTLYSGDGDQKCPDLTQVVPPALNNYDAINAIYAPATWKNNTPTGESVGAITPNLVSFAEPGPKIIILGTDGDPDTCADPDSNGTQPPKDVSLAAVKSAFQQGIQTFIIAVGDDVAGPHQQDMANAGVGLAFPAPVPCDQVNDPTHCAKSYKPANQQALVDAFNSIISGQQTCVFTLDGSVIPGKECEGVVTVNGMGIPCNDPNGWKLNSATEIEFIGSTCALILSDPNVMISGHFPCTSVEPPS
ncbi:MAG: vWA domain-containing protein [Polyangiaceae bacterium]